MARSRLLFAAGALTIGILVALGLAETVVRARGHEPWRRISHLDERPYVAMREPDPAKGWRNKPGVYESPPYAPGGAPSRVRILPDGSRATSDAPQAAGDRVVLIGGSFTFGQAISDEETLAWRLQALDPQRRYANFGVASYGTYQSLLTLEELLSSDDPPSQVIYGYINHHPIRNVARSSWLRHLAKLARTSDVKLPYGSLGDDGRLVRHAPEAYPRWPLREYLATVNLVLDVARDAWHESRYRDRHRITELILLEMQRLCAARQVDLLIALVENEPPKTSRITRFLGDSGIRFVDCRFPHTPDLIVRGEGHPNGEANRRWTDCLAPLLSHR